ncbi:hypothetical protein J1614_010303 [Plenodomus biglobosus]|nr:hypothetical protein J1614_010303 [Plenodomus biglobosus]
MCLWQVTKNPDCPCTKYHLREEDHCEVWYRDGFCTTMTQNITEVRGRCEDHAWPYRPAGQQAEASTRGEAGEERRA